MTAFLPNLQRFLANAAITPAATRGNAPGVNAAIIDSLSVLPLSRFADLNRFAINLDHWTVTITVQAGCPWGTARKCLNIFLRDATYNCFTREHYQLAAVESVLEVPLDGDVAVGLRRDVQTLGLPGIPTWTTIMGLSPEHHVQYQCAAERIAHELYDTHRVHLDLWYWRRE
jgi:hypothetical protein